MKAETDWKRHNGDEMEYRIDIPVWVPQSQARAFLAAAAAIEEPLPDLLFTTIQHRVGDELRPAERHPSSECHVASIIGDDSRIADGNTATLEQAAANEKRHVEIYGPYIES
jgi:hypothetical protein